jgi:RNA polymerase sigma-70 factor, ECF subfamily
MTGTPDEQTLVRAMCAGDETAFDRFFREYAPRVYRFVYSRVDRDAQVAEELSQEVLSRAMQRIAGWRGDAGLFTWLCQMARNEVIDHWRRRQRRERLEVVIEDGSAAADALAALPGDPRLEPERQQLRAELLSSVQVALDSLPENYGNALEWKYIEGLSVTEIAARLGINPVATQSLLARARRSFREALEAGGGSSVDDLLQLVRGDAS